MASEGHNPKWMKLVQYLFAPSLTVVHRNRLVAVIDSGTHVPGVTAQMFDIPPGRALRLERPVENLREQLWSYYVGDGELGVPTIDWLLPSWTKIMVFLEEQPVTMSIGNRVYEAPPAAVLVGVTSQLLRIQSCGGVAICINVSPRGWARLTPLSAETLRDRVTPLEQVISTPLVDELTRALRNSDHGVEVKGVLDKFFLRHLTDEHPDEPIIAKIMALIANEHGGDLRIAAAMLGIEN